jgi:hypothetical protein
MRDQYAGDISDLLKYSLLRDLAGDDRILGIGWYYNPEDDGRNDGSYIDHLKDKNWSKLDFNIWKSLQFFTNSNRSIKAVQNLPIWPKETCFHSSPVPNIRSRSAWASRMAEELEHCNLVFLDPDNGIGKAAKRYTTLDEVKLLLNSGTKALVFIKFPARVPFDQQAQNYHNSLRAGTGAKNILTLRTCVSVPLKKGRLIPRFRWFTLLNYDSVLAERVFKYTRKLNELKHCGVKANIYSDN